MRAITPAHLRTTLLLSTVSSQIKKQSKQEDLKRREIVKQPHVPVYDYDHKFNYRQGYLRDDKIPAFISTKQNQFMKKELETERVGDYANESKSGVVIGSKQ